MRLQVLIALLLLAGVGCTVCARSQASFEVASVHPSQRPVEFERDGQTDVAYGTLRMRDVTVSTCIKWAYNVQQSQVIGPPGMDQQHYDIVAKADPRTTAEEMRPMLRTLLAERFHLQFHHDRRELNAYSMTVDAKGLKMKPSTAADGELYRQNSATGMVARNITMQQLADYVSGPLGAPLLDDTQLPGRFDLVINFTPYVDEDRDHQASPASILNAAFRGDLGLQLSRRKAVLDVLVIDHVEMPSPN